MKQLFARNYINFCYFIPGKLKISIILFNDLSCHQNLTIKFSNSISLLDPGVLVGLVGFTIESELNFKENIKIIIQKTGYKLYAFGKLWKMWTLEKAKFLLSSIKESQFTYCPLIYLFCSKRDMQKVRKLQYKTSHVMYNNYKTIPTWRLFCLGY